MKENEVLKPMIKMKKPSDEAGKVFEDCIKHKHFKSPEQKDLKGRLEDCKNEVIRLSLEFDNKASQHETYKILPHSLVKNVTVSEMMNVYENNMVKGKLGRVYYNKLLKAAPRGICPLCNKREASTLDHYLPKSLFPSLAVTPINLVPSCMECNKSKLDIQFLNNNEETIHPYYDYIDDEDWLFAIIEQDNNISVKYYEKKPLSWDTIKFKRVQHHMKSLKLYELFSVSAAVEINEQKFYLQTILNALNETELKKHLQLTYNSLTKVCKNSWKIALYREMMSNKWFIESFLRNPI